MSESFQESADLLPATVWVAVDDFGDGQPCGGPFASYGECADWIEWDERFEPREMPRGEALAALAETRRHANERYRDSLTQQERDEADLAIRIAETLDEIVAMFGPDAIEWIRAELARVAPVVHATSWWQRPLGWLGIRTRALCGERIVAGKPSGSAKKCRECQRALDGER